MTWVFELSLRFGKEQEESEPQREVDMGSLIESADTYPEVDRPIGFRRNPDPIWEDNS